MANARSETDETVSRARFAIRRNFPLRGRGAHMSGFTGPQGPSSLCEFLSPDSDNAFLSPSPNED